MLIRSCKTAGLSRGQADTRCFTTLMRWEGALHPNAALIIVLEVICISKVALHLGVSH